MKKEYVVIKLITSDDTELFLFHITKEQKDLLFKAKDSEIDNYLHDILAKDEIPLSYHNFKEITLN